MRAMALLPPWERGLAHLDGDDDILLDPERVAWYEPSQERGLVFDLAAVRQPADALGFARKWGLLEVGNTELELADEDRRESVEDWLGVARNLTWMLHRYSLIQRGVEGDADAPRDLARHFFYTAIGTQQLFDGSWRTVDANPTQQAQMAQVDDESFLRGLDLEALISDVRDELAEDLRHELREWNVEFGVSPGDEEELVATGARPPTHFVITASTDTLIGAAYYELLLEITQGTRVGVCPEDRKIFAGRDPRQRYCSRQCAGRVRSRRFAQKRRSPD